MRHSHVIHTSLSRFNETHLCSLKLSKKSSARIRCREKSIMRQSTSTRKSPRPSARGQAYPLSGRPQSSRDTARGASAPSIKSVLATGPPPTVSSDVFEIVADGNADVLAEMIAFSGAQHMSELRSKKPEDYGRNLLHCAVANGQLKTLQVLLKHDVFDPNQARVQKHFDQCSLWIAQFCVSGLRHRIRSCPLIVLCSFTHLHIYVVACFIPRPLLQG